MAVIKDLGAVTAYASAVEGGYTGTKAEFEALMASYATVAEEAAESAESASQSAESASASASTATTKASEATTAAQTATAKAEETQADADAAALDASQALSAASTATTKASEAAQSASDATTAKTAAQAAQTAAEASATTAQTAAQTATQKAAEAAESARTLTIDSTLTQSGQAADSKVVGDKIGEAKSDLTSFKNGVSYIETSTNIIPQDFENGYIVVSSGKLSDRTTAIRSRNFIPVNGGQSVVLMTNPLLTNCYAVEYDSAKQYIGYKSVKYNVVTTLDAGCAFVKMTVNIDAITADNWQTYAQNVGVAYSETQPVPFEEYINDIKIKPSVLPFSVPVINKIEVGVGKRFTSFVNAIKSITDSSETNKYVVYVYPGTYDTVEESEIADGYKGLIVPDYVSIIGIGNRDDIVLRGVLPNPSYAEYANTISTLNYTMNGIIENVVIKSKNLRYEIHDDGYAFGMVDAKHKYKRVKFICEETDSGIVATAYNVGIGAQKNKEVVFEDCLFINENTGKRAVLIHDNAAASQANGARLYIRNCKFDLAQDCSDVVLSNSGGTMECYANICENAFTSGITFTSASSSITTNVWKLFATGNKNYSISKKSGMTNVDITGDIVAFNNI